VHESASIISEPSPGKVTSERNANPRDRDANPRDPEAPFCQVMENLRISDYADIPESLSLLQTAAL